MDGGWSHEEAAQADRELGHLPAVVARDAGAARPRSRTTVCWRAGRASASRREIVRDIALAASGLLNPKIGGRSVFPPLPGFLSCRRPATGRRSGRRTRDRTAIAARCTRSAFARCPIRCCKPSTLPTATLPACAASRSNTPLQALMTLNEPVFLECARSLALRTLTDGGATDAERIVYAFRRCVSRPPTTEEKTELLKLLGKQQERFARADAKPWELAASDPAHPPQLPKGVTPAQAAAWTVVSRVLLNLDETITKE